ncbi:nucleoside deaminase [Mulberry dwarf phytoplasma]|uniref:nucleoside deaminase n=1 Tax=Mulberry dwarf phytoplasma TaxID=186171 RepID=UPI001D11D7EE|nr:nucleoside deaminase [Mulberry dwarf phytoplasma]
MENNNQQHIFFMKEALKEAQKAYLKEEAPIGAVAVLNQKIIARAHNNRNTKKLFFGHAEFLALMKAGKKINSRFLNDVSLYVTLEPCLMCTGAIIQAGIKNLYYGTSMEKSYSFNDMSSIQNMPFMDKLNIQSGILAQESMQLLQKFFQELRIKKNNLLSR